MSAGAIQETQTEIQQLYASGLYLQAFEKSKKLGPITEWESPEARVLGGRLAINLGASRLGRVLHRLAYRQAPENPEATLFYALSMTGRRGLLSSLQWCQQIKHMDSAPDELKADWLAHKARLLASLRDFQTAETLIDQALRLVPERAWLWIERAGIYELEDREAEALQAARKSLELRPWFRPAVQSLAYRLVQMNHDEEAMALLKAATERLESGDVLAQLAALHHELKQYDEARSIYDEVDRYYPLISYSKDFTKWMACRHADAAYYTGDIPRAIEQAKLSDTEFHKRIAKRLEDPELEAKRVHLPVKFVRQHHLTCAPATLSALSSYWSKPAPHLEVAEQICYDGTPAHSERKWATENGFYAREFRVTWESAKLLIDNGIPFTLTTVDPGNAHLQSVVGYDNQRGTLTIQDPGERHASEGAGAELVEHYASSGPRGMAFVPEDDRRKLEHLELPEAEFYDDYFQLELALENHRREDAEAWLQKMRDRDPEHRLTLRARGNLANYDSDYRALLESTEALLEKYPEDVNLLLAKMSCLQDLDLREERLEWLREQTAKADCNPLFHLRYASELSEDAREEAQVEYLLRKVTKYRPHDGQALQLLGSLRWDQHQREQALQLYRYGACVESMNEPLSRTYFQAARSLDRTEEALQFLQDRFDRAGEQSTLPARTLSWAFEQLELMDDSFGVLEKSMQQHPDDGTMLLYAASLYSRYGDGERAEMLLREAEDRNRRTDWLRAKATVSLNAGELETGLECWRRVAQSDPLDSNAHDMIANLLAELDDNETAVAHLKQVVERFPHSLTLNAILIEWLREDQTECEAAVRLFLEKHPTNPWGHRELALSLYTQQKYEEALQSLAMAERVEPNHHLIHFVRGKINESQGDIAAAKENFRETIRQSVDFEPALASLIDICDSKKEREQELQFIQEELRRQVTFGDGLLAYRSLARNTLTPEELLQELVRTREARPDLWHAWSALVYQLTEMDRLDEALNWSEKATQRFGLLSRTWLDLAHVCRVRKEQDREIEALQKAWELNPAWSEPARSLADAYEIQGDTENAEKTLLRAIALEPKESRNYGCLGSLLWNIGRREEAIEALEAAVSLNPKYQWAWDSLRDYCHEAGQPEKFVDAARGVTEKRPNEASSWLLLGELLSAPDQAEEALAATRKAIEIKPRDAEAYSQLAYFLARQGEFDQARQACRPEPFGDAPPLELRSREAWIDTVSGDMETGIKKMQEVLQSDPEYFWAWNQLVEWTDGIPDHKEIHVEAAENMVRIAPRHAPAWGYLADTKLQSEDRAGAKECLRKAVDASPEYLYGGKTLIDLHLEDKEVEQAVETFAIVHSSMPMEWSLSLQTRIAAANGNKADAIESFFELASTPSESYQPLDDCGRSIWEQNWAPEVERLMQRLLDKPTTQPAAGYVWVNLCSTLQLWDGCVKHLNTLDNTTPVWRAAAIKLIEEACEDEAGTSAMQSFVKRHKAQLAQSDDTWYATGEAYNHLKEYKAAQDWLSNWAEHPEADDWSVVLLVMASWATKNSDLATKHAIDAIQARPESPVNDTLMIWVAAHALAYGDLNQANDMLQSLEEPHTSPFFAECHAVFSQVAQILLSSAEYNLASSQIDRVLTTAKSAGEDPIVQRIAMQCRQQLAKLRGKPLQQMLLKLKALFKG